ncbi:MAG: DNA repair protein RecN [Lachnospiraceae bacterium]|nr:DNA repair protein RecN [Lachnospiraceae bacterium]
MLSNLHVKNLALIEECDINLTPGLNILSGETGAGKSILIGSINLALGAKADKDIIRHGAEYGLVELVFENLDDKVQAALEQMDLPVEEDVVIIQRKITPVKSILKINGETVTARQVKALAEVLIDIHGQHEHQSLLKTSKHMEILDAYAGTELFDELSKLKDAYQEYKHLQEELEKENLDEGQRKRELDLLQYEVEEIEQAALKLGEDEALEQDYHRMLHGKQIGEALHKAIQCTDFDRGAGAMVSTALRELKQVVSFSEDLEELDSLLMDIDSLLNDFNREAIHMADALEFSEEDFIQTEERLNVINHLKDKYGKTIEKVLAYAEEKQARMEELLHFEEHLQQLEAQKNRAYNKVMQHGKIISDLRKEAAEKLSQILTKSLLELNFLDVTFEIALKPKLEPTSKGLEEVEFMISTNPGEPLKPMAQVASGGELSRIMLAIKTVLAERDSIDTLIFDEIDSGISGKTAWRVSEKLGQLGKAHQIICITHLPQIAAMADNHFLISKKVQDGSTISSIDALNEEECVHELARMVGADEVDTSATEHARNMRFQAMQFKQNK